MLKVTSLKVNLGEEEIIKEVSFSLSEGEIVVLMGPNGSGKSTIAKTLAGHYDYTVTGGNVILDGADITQSEAYERAQAGLFLAFQNPVSLPGVSVTKLLREIKPELATDGAKYLAGLRNFAKNLEFSEGLLLRGLNDGFSGGEKKKLEILQAELLDRKYLIFDEIDTGLDVDALKKIAESIAKMKKANKGILIITHYVRLLQYLKVDRVLVMKQGQIVLSGQADLVEKIEKEGYKSI